MTQNAYLAKLLGVKRRQSFRGRRRFAVAKQTAKKQVQGTKVSQTGKKISVRWGKVKGADGYQVYVAYCGKNFSAKPVKTVKSASATKVSVEKLNGKKLNLKKNYKVYIAAYKTVDGKKTVIGKP